MGTRVLGPCTWAVWGLRCQYLEAQHVPSKHGSPFLAEMPPVGQKRFGRPEPTPSPPTTQPNQPPVPGRDTWSRLWQRTHGFLGWAQDRGRLGAGGQEAR